MPIIQAEAGMNAFHARPVLRAWAARPATQAQHQPFSQICHIDIFELVGEARIGFCKPLHPIYDALKPDLAP
jgi:hypothetical protein